ncbi:MAG TPA: hypothetical protein VLH38_05155 [Patescibacteria group bacterium]|nr:hypothetical protein [Patescibacteria group bacterium]
MTSPMRISNDFVIWGPSVTSGIAVQNAIHALYYLPPQYTLILPKPTATEKAAYDQVLSILAHDHLSKRVQFSDKQVEAVYHAVVVSCKEDARPGYIFGSTPEALASAILDAARAVT